MTPSLGPLVQSYFIDHLPVQKGLRVGSIRSKWGAENTLP
jgi:integrase/recombinase XerD